VPERVGVEIEQLWHAQRDEPLGPDLEPAGLPLFREYQFPIVIPTSHWSSLQ
jgi:hypothetical protein